MSFPFAEVALAARRTGLREIDRSICEIFRRPDARDLRSRNRYSDRGGDALKAAPLIPKAICSMKPSVQANLAAFQHDARLYLTLGIANWSIFIDHIPNNVANLLTLRNFGFSGAADLFVFVVGYGVAIIHGRMALERGYVVAATRIF